MSADQAASPIPSAETEDQEIVLTVKWGNTNFVVELSQEDTVADLKAHLFSLTDILLEHQKLIGLPGVPMKAAGDDIILKSLKLKHEQRIMLVGTPSDDLAKLEQNSRIALENCQVVDDLASLSEIEDDSAGKGYVLKDIESSKRRLERRITHTTIRIMNEPREGKKLLVLDLDYTLFDCKSPAPSVDMLGRPGLHEFLASAYQHYDLVIWSQTTWRWLEAKITALGMVNAPNYKIAFVLDRTAMFPVISTRGSKERKHEVKALELVWRKFPDRWNKSNTVHVDDLRRNFVLNPQSGLRISAFKNAPVTRATDRELYAMEKYLRLIAEKEQDFATLDHTKWREYIKKNGDATQGGNS